ncbi:MAG: 6-phosphofructokinase [Anaerolineae bacterium]|nr:6-phosphofructokinase [Anaerolineae bacterium]
MKRIAVLTSGGDAPGMNAAVRAVVRIGIHNGLEVFGVRHGYAGLIADEIEPLTARSVGGIMQLGGTFLGSARSEEFKTVPGRSKAIANLASRGIEALVIIGGNGSQAGAYSLHREGFPVVGIASTIDNDLPCTDTSIGVDTAVNVALEAIDRLRVTASSHQRAFLVEVMGRKQGYLALAAGLAGGAELIIIPEVPMEPEEIARGLREAYDRGKEHAIAVVAEGAQYNAEAIAQYFREHGERLGFELRVTTLGHVQRGGAPGAFDRLLATRFGAQAVEALIRGETGVVVVIQEGNVRTVPLEEVVHGSKPLDLRLYELAQVLAK